MASITPLLRSAVCEDSTFGCFASRIKQITKLHGEDAVAGIVIYESFSDSPVSSGFRRRLVTSIETRLLSPFAILRYILDDPEIRDNTCASAITQVLQSKEQQVIEQLTTFIYRPLANALRGCKVTDVASCLRLVEFAHRIVSQVHVVLDSYNAKVESGKSLRRSVVNALFEALEVLLTRFYSLFLVLHRAQLSPATTAFCDSLRAMLTTVATDKGPKRADDEPPIDKKLLERLEARLNSIEVARDPAKLLGGRNFASAHASLASTPLQYPEPLNATFCDFGNDEVRLCFSTMLLTMIADSRVLLAEESVSRLADRVSVLLRAGRASCDELPRGGLAFELVRTALLLMADASSIDSLPLSNKPDAEIDLDRCARLAIRLTVFVATRFAELLAAVLSRCDTSIPATESVPKCIDTLLRGDAHRALREAVERGVGRPILHRFLGSLLRAKLLRADFNESMLMALRGTEGHLPRLALIEEALQFVDSGAFVTLRATLNNSSSKIPPLNEFLVACLRSPARLFALRCVLESRNELGTLAREAVKYLVMTARSSSTSDESMRLAEFAFVFCSFVRDDSSAVWQKALHESQLNKIDIEDALLSDWTSLDSDYSAAEVERYRTTLLDSRSFESLTFAQLQQLQPERSSFRTIRNSVYSLLVDYLQSGTADMKSNFALKVKSEIEDKPAALAVFERIVDGLNVSRSDLCASLCARTLLRAVYTLRTKSALRAAERRVAARVIDGCVNRDADQEDALGKPGNAENAASCDDIFGSSLPNESTLMLLARRESVSTTALRIFLDVTEKLPAAASQSQVAATSSESNADVKEELSAVGESEQKLVPSPEGFSQIDALENERDIEKERRLVSLAGQILASGCLANDRAVRRELAALSGGFAESFDSESVTSLDISLASALSRVIGSECGVLSFDAAAFAVDAVDRCGNKWLVRTLFETFLCTEERLAPAQHRRTCATLLAVFIATGCDAASLSELLRLTVATLRRCVARASHAFTDTNVEYLAAFLSTLLHAACRLPNLATRAEMNECIARFLDSLRQLVRGVASGHLSVCHLFAKRIVHLFAGDCAIDDRDEASEQLLAQIPLELLGDLHVIAHLELELPLVLRLFDVRLLSLDQTVASRKRELVECTLSLIEHFRLTVT